MIRGSSGRSSSPPILRALDRLGDYYCGDVDGSLLDENPLSSPSSGLRNSSMGITIRHGDPASPSTHVDAVECEVDDDDQRPGQQSYEEYLLEAAAASVSGELSDDLASNDGNDDQHQRKMNTSIEEDPVSLSLKTPASARRKSHPDPSTPSLSVSSTPRHHAFLSPFSPLLNVSKHEDRPFDLSLSNARKVSVVIQVDQSRDGTDDSCLFPVVKNSRSDGPPSPRDYSWNDLVVVNPSAFGKDISTTVTMERARLVSQIARQSSEDWIRSYRFNQVVWSDLEVESTRCWVNLCRAMAQDVTVSGSISNRTIISVGNTRSVKGRAASGPALSPSSVSRVAQVPSRTEILFGNVACDSVAHVLAQDSVGLDPKNQSLVLKRYGLLGLTAQKILEFVDDPGRSLPLAAADEPLSTLLNENTVQRGSRLTLSMLEIADENVVFDLLKLKPFARENAVKVKHHGGKSVGRGNLEGGTSAASLIGVTDTPLDSLRTLGRCVRRAFTMAYHSRRTKPRGTILAILKLWDPTDTGRHTTVQFCDVAEVAPEDDGSFWRESQKGRNARLRQSLASLGAVLRRILLREAGNQTAISFRDHTLTQVLSRGLANFDSRVIVLANLSSQNTHYSETLATLRFVSSILTRPGDPLMSPFDDNTKATSPMSRSSADVESFISSSSLDMQHGEVLRDLLSDPRQRIAKLVKPKKKSLSDDIVDLSGEKYVPTTYMDMDPGAAAKAIGKRAEEVAGVGEAAVAALPTSVSYDDANGHYHDDSSVTSAAARFVVDAFEAAPGSDNSFQIEEPSPLATDAGTRRGQTGAPFHFHDPLRHASQLRDDKSSGFSPQSKGLKRVPDSDGPSNHSVHDESGDEVLEVDQVVGAMAHPGGVSTWSGSAYGDRRILQNNSKKIESTQEAIKSQRMDISAMEAAANEYGRRRIPKLSFDEGATQGNQRTDEDDGMEFQVARPFHTPLPDTQSFRKESIDSGNREKENLKLEIQRLQSKNRTYEVELRDLRNSIEEAQVHPYTDMKSSIASLEQQLESVRKEVVQKSEEAHYWRVEASHLREPDSERQVKHLRDEYLTLQARERESREAMQNRLDTEREENQLLLRRRDEQIRDLHDQLETLIQSAERSALDNAMEAESRQQSLEARGRELRQETQKEVDWLRQAVETRDAQIAELQQFSANLGHQIQESQDRILQELELERARQRELTDQLHQIEGELAICKMEATKKDAALIRLQGSLEVANRNFQHAKQEGTEDVELLKQRVQELQLQLDRELESHLHEIRKRDEEIQAVHRELYSEKESGGEAIRSVGDDLVQARVLIGNRESRIQELTSAMEAVEAGRAEVLKIAEEAIATQADLEQKVADLEDELRGIESRTAPLERLHETERSRDDAIQALRKSHTELLQVTTERDSMRLQLSELLSTLHSVEKERDHLMLRKTEHEHEISRLQDVVQSLQSTCKDEEALRTENLQLLQELSQIKSYWSTVETDLVRQLQEREGEAQLCREEVATVKNELAQVIAGQRASSAVRERELDELREEVAAAEDELARAKAAGEGAAQERESARLRLLELDRVKNLLSSRESDVQSLTEKLQTALEEKEAAVAKSAAFKRALSQFQESTRSRVVNFVRHRSETKSLLDRTLEENRALAEQTQKLQAAFDDVDWNPHGPLGRERAEALNLLEISRKENSVLRSVQSELRETINLLRSELEATRSTLATHTAAHSEQYRQTDRDHSTAGAEGLLRRTLGARSPSVPERRRQGSSHGATQAWDGPATAAIHRAQDGRDYDRSARSPQMEGTVPPTLHAGATSWPGATDMVVSIALAAKQSAELLEADRLQLRKQLEYQRDAARTADVEALKRRVQLLENQSARSDVRDSKHSSSTAVQNQEDDILQHLSRRVAILEGRLAL